MTHCTGFPPISRRNARVLILGSLPGVESLKQQQYYAKKQNSFWKIMGELAGAAPDLPYETRLKCLMQNRIALWDVCATAFRPGSLDSAIQSPQANDFAAFFKTHKKIELICFNGQPAAKFFRLYVEPTLPASIRAIPRQTLPSTSPAHAGMKFDQKLSLWRAALAPPD